LAKKGEDCPMTKMEKIKLAELKFNRAKAILYYLLSPLLAIVSLIVVSTLQDRISLFAAIAAILYVFMAYGAFLVSFSKDTQYLIKELEGKKK
jgi:hypothetical protein